MGNAPRPADSIIPAQMAAFGEVITYTPQGGQAREITAIFDAQHEEMEIGAEGVPVNTRTPVLRIALSDLDPDYPKRDDAVTIPPAAVSDSKTSGDYLVANVEPDGEGGALLRLRGAEV